GARAPARAPLRLRPAPPPRSRTAPRVDGPRRRRPAARFPRVADRLAPGRRLLPARLRLRAPTPDPALARHPTSRLGADPRRRERDAPHPLVRLLEGRPRRPRRDLLPVRPRGRGSARARPIPPA